MRFSRILVCAGSLIAPFSPLAAQAWSYPALQPPRVAIREFNFGLADAGGAGTTLLFQWREDYGPRRQLSLDAGIADPNVPRSDLMVFFGGQYAQQIGNASTDVPLDFLFTVGAYYAGGDFSLFRFPVGVSVGHRFELEESMAVTPYVHPRLSLDVCDDCRGASDLAVTFDIGANFDITNTMAVRGAALFTGNNSFDHDGFGLSFAWTPPGLLRRPIRR